MFYCLFVCLSPSFLHTLAFPLSLFILPLSLSVCSSSKLKWYELFNTLTRGGLSFFIFLSSAHFFPLILSIYDRLTVTVCPFQFLSNYLSFNMVARMYKVFCLSVFITPFSSVTPFLPLCTFLSISVCLSITQSLNPSVLLNLSVYFYLSISSSLFVFSIYLSVTRSPSIFKSLFLSHTPRCLSVSQHVIRFFLSINVRI